MPTRLETFLEKYRIEPGQGKQFTFQDFADKRNMWSLTEDDLSEFYKIYFEEHEDSIPHYLTEKQTAIGQLRIDLDFKYDGNLTEHKHTQTQTISFIGEYMKEVCRYLKVPDTVDIYILEKTRPTYDAVNKVSRSGIHVQVPGVKTRSGVEQAIKRGLVKRMEEFFPNLGCVNPKGWDDIYDPSPLTHNSPWMVLGSKKNDGLPYKIKYVLEWDKTANSVSVKSDIPKMSIELIRNLSLRSKPTEETEMTDWGKENVHQGNINETTGHIQRIVARGRSAERNDQGSRSSSPGRIVIPPLSQEQRDYYTAHVNNLAPFRYTCYADWISVGQCLKNLHPDLNDLWHEFSAKGDGYKFPETESKWTSFGFKIDGARLGLGSLRIWSSSDNLEGYKEIESRNIDSLMKKSVETSTENDVAQVIYAKYRDEFKCAKFGQNVWYRYNGNIWTETDRGIALQIRLSKYVADMYLDKETQQLNIIKAIGQCDHAKDPKPDCQSCRAEQDRKAYNSIRLKLKRTGFKESVMKECRELFLDEQLALKLDENKHLIAFNNGVYDTLTQTFRAGQPEDYISFSTNIEYSVDTRYYELKCWPEVEKFLHDILPNKNVRDYFIKHLSKCLSGTFNQQFHILTGSGSNGKSMLMNLCATGFGEYFYKANIAMFTQKRGKAGSASPEMVRMKGRRFVMMSEPDEGEPLSTGFMKEITSSEKIIARDLYAGSKAMVEFDVQAKCHLACNDKPKVNTTDGGTWRRLKVIDFPSKFVVNPRAPNELPMDPTIESKVLSKEWAECFMAYLVHLYTEGKGLHDLVPPKEVDAYTNEYKEDSDAIAKFISEFFHPLEPPSGDGPVEGVTWSHIQSEFARWKRENEAKGSAPELRKRIEIQYGVLPKNSHAGWMNFRFGQN